MAPHLLAAYRSTFRKKTKVFCRGGFLCARVRTAIAAIDFGEKTIQAVFSARNRVPTTFSFCFYRPIFAGINIFAKTKISVKTAISRKTALKITIRKTRIKREKERDLKVKIRKNENDRKVSFDAYSFNFSSVFAVFVALFTMEDISRKPVRKN